MKGKNNKKFICLTNIPTPYRIHLFNVLQNEFSKREIEFEVLFMARSEPGRYWDLSEKEFNFPYRFSWGMHPLIHKRQFHINPGHLMWLWQKPPTWLLLSGSWYFPTVFLGNWLSRNRGTKTMFWNESNLAYIERDYKQANWWRKFILDGFDCYVVPGKWAKEYVNKYAPSSGKKPVLLLPNVVNEAKFKNVIAHNKQKKTILLQKWGLTEDKVILVSVARLEPIKGVNNLISAICDFDNADQINLIIAGDGSQREYLSKKIIQNGIDEHIRMVGQLTEDELLELLSLADCFILPSIGDPFPLAVIEAAFGGLPLLLSNRVGCHPETLINGENGFLFDPINPESIHSALDRFLILGKNGRLNMGKRSLDIAEERFATQKVVRSFVDEIINL